MNPQEKDIIKQDLESRQFTAFKEDKGERLSLPAPYSADSTYLMIEERIEKLTGRKKLKHLLYYGAAASIALILTFAWLFQTNKASQDMITVSTSYGETKELFLPDSSRVVLNALSSIVYPREFPEDTRSVTLRGEAFFHVRKSEGKTFTVQAREIQVEVLGTQFNIHAYENDKQIRTSLLEGSINVRKQGSPGCKLHPGETAVYDPQTDSLLIASNDVQTVSLWQEGILAFEDLPLKDILQTLSRTDNVEFIVKDEKLNDFRLTARFSHHESMEEMLTILGNAAIFNYYKQGKKYIIQSNH